MAEHETRTLLESGQEGEFSPGGRQREWAGAGRSPAAVLRPRRKENEDTSDPAAGSSKQREVTSVLLLK